MARGPQDEETPQRSSDPVPVSAREPDAPDAEADCPPPDEDELQVIEEPGYGHGV